MTDLLTPGPSQIEELHRDGRHLDHTVFRADGGSNVVAVIIKSHPQAKSEAGETSFFFELGENYYGFRWTDRQDKDRFVQYAGNCNFIRVGLDAMFTALIDSAHDHFALQDKLEGVLPGYIPKEGLINLMQREDIIGISAGTVENPPGVIHLLWLDPDSPYGKKVGPDNEGDRMIELKIYPEAIGLRWITPENEVRFMVISGDQTSISAMLKDSLDELDIMISLALGVPLDVKD